MLVPIGAALGLANPLAIAATAATVAIALVIPVVWGGLQGAGQFRELSGRDPALCRDAARRRAS